MIDQFIDAGGIRTRYLEAGKGPALILVHGGGPGADAWSNWRKTLPALSKRFRVLAYDVVGFGLTDKPDSTGFVYSQEARVKHLIAFIEALGSSPLSLIGNSMGGAVGLGTCIARPDLVDKLVLMGSGGLITQVNANLKAAITYTPSLENMRRALQLLTREGFEIEPEVVEYRYGLSCDPAALAAYTAGMEWVVERGGLFYPEEEISQIKNKTLIIHGKLDRVVPPEMGWRFCNLIPNAWFHLMPDCGHWAMIEQPEEFNTITNWFLTEA